MCIDNCNITESGYDGYSMSNNAIAAYDNDEKPLSKWSKDDILRIARQLDWDKAVYLAKVPLEELRDRLLKRTSWHHTSSYYNKTDFYSFDDDAFDAFKPKDARDWVEYHKQVLSDRAKEKKKNHSRKGRIDYLTWGGSRAHPKAYEEYLDDVYIEERGSFYVVTDEKGREILRKKIGSTGTHVRYYENESLNDGLHQAHALKPSTPYMLRNDGELTDCSPMHPYIMRAYEKSKIINLMENRDEDKITSINWFYEHTSNPRLKDTIDSILKYFGIKESSSYKPSKDEVLDFITQANHMANQEFLRIRTSHMLYGGNDKSLYARISSVDFNWYPLLFNLLTEYTGIECVTLCKDSNTFGGRFEPYRINGIECDNLPVDEFLCIKGHPVVEGIASEYDLINKAREALSRGEPLNEAYDHMHPRYLNGWYEMEIAERLEDNMEHSQYPINEINTKLQEARPKTAVKSNGVYSVLNNKWIKEPVQSDIPDVDEEAFDKLFSEWEDRYFELIKEVDLS